MLFKLIIVEDEEILRNVLPKIINWKECGFEIIASVSNGLEALDVLSTQHADVVLTDIRMPKMNGLELACEIQVRKLRTKVILLSAYSEFEYAQKGIEYGVYSYLLKTAEEEEIEAFFKKTYKELISNNQKLNNRNELEVLKKDFILNILSGSLSSNQIKHGVDTYKLNLFNEGFYISIVDIDNKFYFKDIIHNNFIGKLLKKVEVNINDELEGIVDYLHFIHHEHIILIFDAKNISNIKELSISLNESASHYLDSHMVSVTISVSEKLNSYNDLELAYKSVKKLLDHRSYLGGAAVLTKDKCKNGKNTISEDSQVDSIINNYFIQDPIDPISSIFVILDKVADIFKDEKVVDKRLIEGLYIKLVNKIFLEHSFKLDVRVFKIINKLETINSITSYLKLTFEDYVNNNLKNNYNNLHIKKAVTFLENNFTNPDICLDMVADYVNLHPVYLSGLFNKELKTNFKYILNNLRVSHVEKLMRDSDLKIYEIAEQCGYRNNRYFSDAFKKMTGKTPMQYRNSL